MKAKGLVVKWSQNCWQGFLAVWVLLWHSLMHGRNLLNLSSIQSSEFAPNHVFAHTRADVSLAS